MVVDYGFDRYFSRITVMTTYKDLLAQRDALNIQIDQARKSELADAKAKVRAIIEEFGLTAADCGFSKQASSTKTGNKVAAKYITPDSQHTWTGRGNAPKAFQVLIDQGHKKEEFLIKKDSV